MERVGDGLDPVACQRDLSKENRVILCFGQIRRSCHLWAPLSTL